jgi:hypothetical protein
MPTISKYRYVHWKILQNILYQLLSGTHIFKRKIKKCFVTRTPSMKHKDYFQLIVIYLWWIKINICELILRNIAALLFKYLWLWVISLTVTCQVLMLEACIQSECSLCGIGALALEKAFLQVLRVSHARCFTSPSPSAGAMDPFAAWLQRDSASHHSKKSDIKLSIWFTSLKLLGFET